MTGIELARVMRATKGKIAIPMAAGDNVPYIFAQKQDLIAWATKEGENETGMTLEPDGDEFMLVNVS